MKTLLRAAVLFFGIPLVLTGFKWAAQYWRHEYIVSVAWVVAVGIWALVCLAIAQLWDND